jgi:hypothetical protein
MKRPAEFLRIAFLIASVTCNAASPLTFDELPVSELTTDVGYTIIPNGYGSLRWDYFGVLNGAIRPEGEGYHDGMVSPNNVAFNISGEPASILVAGGLFDLNSAYLKLALNLDTPLNIRVQGFVSTTATYDNTYTVYRTAPTLISFDYVGVDRVTFISSPKQQFAMDNLVVTIPEPSTIKFLICGGVLAGVGRRHEKRRQREPRRMIAGRPNHCVERTGGSLHARFNS